MARYNPEVYSFCGSPGNGNYTTALLAAQALKDEGIPTIVHCARTPSTWAGSVMHRRMTANGVRAAEYTNGQAVAKRDSVLSYLHSINLIAEIIRNRRELTRHNPDRITLWTQELGLAALSPAMARHLFGKIYLMSPDTYGKTQGKLSARKIAGRLGATILHCYQLAVTDSLQAGVDARLISPYIPSATKHGIRMQSELPPAHRMLERMVKESGSGMDQDLKNELIRTNRGAIAFITPTHIDHYIHDQMISSHKRTTLQQIYEDMASNSIREITTYPSEMVQFFMALTWAGVEPKVVNLLPDRGYWESDNRRALVDVLGQCWEINQLAIDPDSQTLYKERLYPTSPIDIHSVLGNDSIASAIGLR